MFKAATVGSSGMAGKGADERLGEDEGGDMISNGVDFVSDIFGGDIISNVADFFSDTSGEGAPLIISSWDCDGASAGVGTEAAWSLSCVTVLSFSFSVTPLERAGLSPAGKIIQRNPTDLPS